MAGLMTGQKAEGSLRAASLLTRGVLPGMCSRSRWGIMAEARIIRHRRASARLLARKGHVLQEYTRLVSSTFWKKLENASQGREDWADTEEMILYLTNPRVSAPLAFVLARILQR